MAVDTTCSPGMHLLSIHHGATCRSLYTRTRLSGGGLLGVLQGEHFVDDWLQLAFCHQSANDLQLSAAWLHKLGAILGAPTYCLPQLPTASTYYCCIFDFTQSNMTHHKHVKACIMLANFSQCSVTAQQKQKPKRTSTTHSTPSGAGPGAVTFLESRSV